MSTTLDLLRRAYDYETDSRRPPKFRFWQHHSIRATKDEVKQLVESGYACIAIRSGALIKYELTEKGREMACRDVTEMLQSVSKNEVLEGLSLVVGFDDLKEAIASAIAAHRKVNFMLEGPPASIHGDTEVWIDMGEGPQSVAIASLLGQEFKSLSVHPITLKAGWYPAEVSEHTYAGDWIEITGVGILPFSVTATHSLVAYDPVTGFLIPRKAGDLLVGEIIPVMANYPYIPSGKKRCINDQSIALDTDLGFLLGFWLGDGGLSQGKKNYISFTNNNRDVLERIKSYLITNINPSWHYWRGGCLSRSQLTVQHQPLYEFLKTEFLNGDGEAGIKGRTARWKCLPGWVMKSPEPFVRALLNGYFYADGTVANGFISACSTSPYLVRDIAMLITRLGIVPGVHYHCSSNDYYTLSIRQCDALKFMEKVGIFRENKEVSTSVILHDESFKIPFPFTSKLANSLTTSIRKGRRSQSMTRRAAIEYLDTNWTFNLSTLMEADIRWVRVDKLRRFQEPKQKVYDLSVPEAETFVLGNRVLVHNCAKSVLLEGIRSVVPNAYQAFGSRTSAAGLSEVLFEQTPQLLLLDEADKMRHDVYSVLLGLMESGEILETKIGKTRGIILQTIVIAACNSSKKMSPEFLSRFALHAHFPEYTRDEFVDVVIGMLGRDDCPEDIARIIGNRVYELRIGDVRKARGVWQLMMLPTEEEVERVIRMNIKYGPQNARDKRRRQTGDLKLPGME